MRKDVGDPSPCGLRMTGAALRMTDASRSPSQGLAYKTEILTNIKYTVKAARLMALSSEGGNRHFCCGHRGRCSCDWQDAGPARRCSSYRHGAPGKSPIYLSSTHKHCHAYQKGQRYLEA